MATKEIAGDIKGSPRPKGLFNVKDFSHKMQEYREKGLNRGLSTGIRSLDRSVTMVKGMLYVVTGMPSSGKSELVDAIMVNTAHAYDWKWGVFSPENFPLSTHIAKLSEKFIGSNYLRCWVDNDKGGGWQAGFTNKQITTSEKFISERFEFVYPANDDVALDTILHHIEWLAVNEGLDGAVIDPWNELTHNIPSGMSESTYIGVALGKIRRLARRLNIVLVIVAHPTKLQKDKRDGTYPIPTLYDINGSANWRNKADIGIIVHRDNPNATATRVFIAKIKQKGIGKCGEVGLNYDIISGRYSDHPIEFALPPRGGWKDCVAWAKDVLAQQHTAEDMAAQAAAMDEEYIEGFEPTDPEQEMQPEEQADFDFDQFETIEFVDNLPM